MFETPCYGCPDRSAECHSDCPAYQDWRRQRNEQLVQEYMARESYIPPPEWQKRIIAQQRREYRARCKKRK